MQDYKEMKERNDKDRDGKEIEKWIVFGWRIRDPLSNPIRSMICWISNPSTLEGV